jgi:hypothetical protein
MNKFITPVICKHFNKIYISAYITVACPSYRAVWGERPDRLYAEIVGSDPA